MSAAQSLDDLRCTICGKSRDPALYEDHRKCPAIAEHIKQRIDAYPRCNACTQPMTAGQTGTHLSCREQATQPTKGTK